MKGMKNFQKRNNNKRKNESGNVLFYILIAIVLFAALSFVVGGMMRGGNADMIGEEQAKLFAGEILDYARVVRQAVQDVRISNGCTDTEIRFVNNVTSGYGTSVRSACDIFDPAGGDVRYAPPVDKWGAGTEWIFANNLNLAGYGAGGTPDLIMVLSDVNLTVCNAINQKLGHSFTSPPAETALSTGKFTGTWAGAGAALNCDPIGNCSGLLSACINALNYNGAQSYIFYQALIPR